MKADSIVRSTCPYCGVGCQVLLNVKDEHIFRIDAPFEAAPNYGRLCVKGRFGAAKVLLVPAGPGTGAHHMRIPEPSDDPGLRLRRSRR